MLVPASDVVRGVKVVGIDEVIVGDNDTVDSNGIFVDEMVGLLVGNIDPVVDWKVVVSPAVWDKAIVDSNGIIVDEMVGLLVGNIDPVVDWKEVVSPAVEAAGVLASVLSDFVELPNENPFAVFSITVVSVGSLPP